VNLRRLSVIAIGLAGFAAACGSAAGDPATAPEGRDIALVDDGTSVEARVPRNATLETLLRQHNVSADVAQSLVSSVRDVFNPRELRADRTYRITHTLDGLFREFRYQIDADRLLRVVSRVAGPGEPAAFEAEIVTIPKEYALDAVEAKIGVGNSSLVGALEAQGENVQLALDLATAFAGEVDFNSDLQRGDRIQVLFERAVRYGEFAGYGEVKAAILENAGRRLVAIRMNDANGNHAWYDEQGRSLRRQFLQSPLPFDPRVTSRFSYRRLHPVKGIYRAHLGVDYGAPYGTAVNTVASGVVEFAGTSGDAGRMVRVRHSGGYQTAYLHLSSFGPGIRVGARVEQGQLIGRVGATGSATAPHLDYRIMKNGVYVNPLTELKKMPKGEPIAGEALAAFFARRDEALAALQDRLAASPSAQPEAPTNPEASSGSTSAQPGSGK